MSPIPLLLALAAVAPPGAPLAARLAVRECVRVDVPPAESLDACRAAAARGLPREWSAGIRVLLARRLGALGRWEEVADVYRELTEECPGEPEWPSRLAAALLYGLNRTEDAERAAREALARDGGRAEAWALLGAALAADGRVADSVAAFDRARELDAALLESRPALLEVEQAARSGSAWP